MRYKFALALPAAAALFVIAPFATRPALAGSITACQTISKPGSYILAANLTSPGFNCLVIAASLVTVDLQGFSISGFGLLTEAGIVARRGVDGITVRNGFISGFGTAVDLPGVASIVEGLQVTGPFGPASIARLTRSRETPTAGIVANGIIKNNIVTGASATGISAGGTVTGNYAFGNNPNRGGGVGIMVSKGSTVIGNTADKNEFGLIVACPSNVTDNTATGNFSQNLVLNGTGCKNTNNVAP
jgi:hypothetical protein